MRIQTWGWGLLSAAALVACLGANCQLFPILGLGGSSVGVDDGGTAPPAGDPISKGRINAARLLDPASTVFVDLVQRDLADPTQDRCFPLGDGGALTEWPSRLGPLGGVALSLVNAQPPIPISEYDVLRSVGETDYILSIRALVEPTSPLHFTSLEFNFRAVNPHFSGHVQGTHYTIGQAFYPSNDDVIANRSLVDLENGGDVAIVIRGLAFENPATVANTRATMANLGPAAWVLFMRDNALNSGRYFNITSAFTGAPRALLDTPSPLDDGILPSVQVNGDFFTIGSEPPGNVSPGPPAPQLCVGAPTRPYAFVDISNLDEDGLPAAGRAGLIFIMRREAFNVLGVVTNVVVDPSVLPPGPPALNNQIPAPPSGYNEPIVQAIVGPDEDDNSGGVTPGAHELSISAFFVHTPVP